MRLFDLFVPLFYKSDMSRYGDFRQSLELGDSPLDFVCISLFFLILYGVNTTVYIDLDKKGIKIKIVFIFFQHKTLCCGYS